eukprot:11207482-Alexandrium_andersonii.AAC.1
MLAASEAVEAKRQKLLNTSAATSDNAHAQKLTDFQTQNMKYHIQSVPKDNTTGQLKFNDVNLERPFVVDLDDMKA